MEDRANQVLSRPEFEIVDTPTIPPELLAWDLGAGETGVLAFALANHDFTAIIDEGAARRCARSLGVNMKGTLSVALKAREVGLVPSAADLIRSLRENGFRIDDETIREALRRIVNEDW